MDPEYRKMVAFLGTLGIDDVPHSGQKGFLAHLIGVYKDLDAWGCDRDLCRAGLFHSIYGTEMFRRWALPLERRDEVKSLIGERAEWIAYVNCLMDRSTFDALLQSDGPYRIRNRESGEIMEMTRRDFDDLVCLHLCDWLEQVGRSDMWDYRHEAWKQMAHRLGGVALENYQRVFAAAPATSA
ncbi:MAG: hypothetical protein JNG89_08430 [Planctomycetaceae bacterium]|nr:hypothetical protein [Planctomycetaceae bacterium]